MSAQSKIEWTNSSWNPIRALNLKTGRIGWHCEHATTGCEFCYSEGFNKRLGTGLPFKPGHRKDIEIFLDEEMLTAPLRWKKPRMIFVCSMTDAFAEFVNDEWLDKMFAVMALCPQHTFQVLTKRAERMRQWFADVERANYVGLAMLALVGTLPHGHRRVPWPLHNVWLGVSCERQQEADERIPLLLQTPAAVRFISAEPLLSEVSFRWAKWDNWCHPNGRGRSVVDQHDGLRMLDWVIVGGESGPNARPFHLTWAESIVEQCREAGVACFVKQLGACAMFCGYPMHYADRKGGDWSEWPDSLRVRQFPSAPGLLGERSA